MAYNHVYMTPTASGTDGTQEHTGLHLIFVTLNATNSEESTPIKLASWHYKSKLGLVISSVIGATIDM